MMDIVSSKTTVKVVVQRLAEEADTLTQDAVFLVPVNGGHATAKFVSKAHGYYFFKVSGIDFVMPYPSLENIYLV